jgi:hypothetical protein
LIRVCLIGNSHFAAIKKGWDLVPELADKMQLTFFGSPGSMLRTLKVGDGCLYDPSEKVSRYLSVTSGGLRTIEARSYDVFLLVSLELSFAIATDMYSQHRLVEHQARGLNLISQGALENGLLGAMRSTLATETAAKIRQLSPAPIVFVTAPLPNPAMQHHIRYRRQWNGKHLPFLLDLYNRKLRDLGAELGVHTYTQPQQTVAPPCFTDPVYALDHEVSGLHHTNERFGAELLLDIAPLLLSLPPENPESGSGL